ncbi:MAG TPA: hypothetical protein VGG69_06995 [Rhizomicrobium sp.]|jgi:hypothetical protein
MGLCVLLGGPAAADEAAHVLCGEKPSTQEIFRAEYCDGLRQMHEPAVPADHHPNSREVYRFLWFRSFHPAVIIRIDVLPDMSGTLTLHSLQTITALSNRRVEVANRPIDSIKLLSRRHIAGFRELVASAEFWKSPSQFHLDMGFGPLGTPIPKDQEIVASDGAQWVIEGENKNQYHLMGDEGSIPGPVWDIGLAMLHLAQKTNPSWLMGPVY